MTQPAIDPFVQSAPPPYVPPQGDAGAEVQPPPVAPIDDTPPVVGVEASRALDPSKLTDAFKASKLLFHEDERVAVKLADGQLGKVDAKDLPGVVDSGGQLVHPDEYHAAEIEKKYGDGLGNTAAASAFGLGRGLSAGIQDPLLVAGAQAFGGDKSAAEMRERLGAYEHLHPWASGISEGVGMLAPAVLSGGTSLGVEAGVEGAGLAARGAGLAARGLRGAGIANEGIGIVGKAAETLAAKVVGHTAENAILSAAQKVASHAAGAGAEGALYAQGQMLSEQAINPDPNMNAEKWLAETGHGAALGAIIGGSLSAAGSAAQPLLKGAKGAIAKASPFFKAKAETEAFRVLNGRVKFTKAAEKIPDGAAGVGRALLDRVGLTATDTTETLLPKIEAVKAQDFDRIEQSFAPVADDTASLKSVLDPLEARAREFDKREGYEAAAKAIRERIESIRRRYTPGGAEAEDAITKLRNPPMPKEPPQVNPALAGNETKYALDLADPNAGIAERAEAMPGTLAHEQPPIKIDMTRPGHIGDGVFVDPAMREGTHIGEAPIGMRVDEAATKAAHDAPIHANRTLRLENFADDLAGREQKIAKIAAAHDARVAAIDPAKIRVRLGDLLEQRRNYEGTIDFHRDGSVLTDGKRAFGRTLEDIIVDHGEKSAAAKGLAGWSKEYGRAKLDWRRMKVAADAATDAISRSESNAGHSLTDKMIGVGGALVGAATHGIGGAILGHGAQYLSTQVRKRANAALAVTFDKLASLQVIARASDRVDLELARGVKSFLHRATGNAEHAEKIFASAKTIAGKAIPSEAATSTEDAREVYGRRVAQLQTAVKTQADHAPISAELSRYAPATAAAIAQRAAGTTAWLAAQIPKPPKYGSQTPSDQDVKRFNMQAAAVDAPARTIAAGLKSGGLQKVQVDAIAATSPAIFDQIKKMVDTQLQRAMAEQGARVPYDVRRDAALLFGSEAEWSMTAAGVKALQDGAQTDAANQQAQKPGSGGGGGPHKSVKTPSAQTMMGAAERRMGGSIR